MGQRPANLFDLLKEWEAEKYDGLRGTIEQVWAPAFIKDKFTADRITIAGALCDHKITPNQVVESFQAHLRMEELLRLEDRCLAEHMHAEAEDLQREMLALKMPEESVIDQAIVRLVRLRCDLESGEDACRELWLGKDLAHAAKVGINKMRTSAAGGSAGSVVAPNAVVKMARNLYEENGGRRGLARLVKERGSFSYSIRQIDRILNTNKIH